jgi:hypothetical protein
MGFDVNQAAAVMGVLEKELGLTGMVARVEFAKAVSQAKGNVSEFYNILGITEEQLGKYTAQVEQSANVIPELAAAHAEHYTVLQKVQHWVSELFVTHGKTIEQMSMLAPVLMGASMAVGALGTAYTVLSKISWSAMVPALKGVATSLWGIQVAGGPVLWIIEGLMIAIIAFAVAWHKNWGGIQEKTVAVLNWIGDALKTAMDFWLEVFEIGINKILGWVDKLPGIAIEWRASFTEIGKDLSLNLGDGFKKGMDTGMEAIQEAVDKVKGILPGSPDKAEDEKQQGADYVNNIIDGIKDGAEKSEVLPEAGDVMAETIDQSIENNMPIFEEAGMLIPEGVANGIESGSGALGEAIDSLTSDVGQGLADGLNKTVDNVFEISGKALKKFDMNEYLRGLSMVSPYVTYQPQAPTRFQRGGIATSPTLGILGETQPEAVIPLNQMNKFGGQPIVVNLNLNGAIFNNDDDYRSLVRKTFDFFTEEQRRRGVA